MNGEKIGKAWDAAMTRLPEGWIIDRLELSTRGMWVLPDGEITQKADVWTAHARPFEGFAWKRAGVKRIRDAGFNGQGLSAVDALLALAIRAEKPSNASLRREERRDAVDALFRSLFPA